MDKKLDLMSLLESESWVASEQLLDDMFSLEQSPLAFLEDALADFPLQPASSSSSSDSGLSSDQTDFDFEQELCPFLIQNSCDEAGSPGSAGTSGEAESEGGVGGEWPAPSPVEDTFDQDHFEQNVVPGFINNDTFHSPGKTRKRRLSQTPQATVQPKVQKAIVRAAPAQASPAPPAPAASQPKPQLVVKAQPQQPTRPVKLTNIQLLSPHTKVYSKPVETVAPQRRVIRVAPMAGGNPRSILLPVTIKDMKDLKSIKIINAADLKNSADLQLAAASLLSRSKRRDALEHRTHREEEDHHNDDSGSEASDDEDTGPPEPAASAGAGGYPRLVLSAEERRLLAKEGVRLPARYPLTKHEERELKRIRRKIRNKISAQDSRKRKKEYVDGLEDRVKQCTAENQTLIRRIKILQSQNHSLTAQLKRLQKVLSGGGVGATPPATCLMVLLLSVALVALPSMRDTHAPHSAPGAPGAHAAHAASEAGSPRPATPPALTRALLSATALSADETVIDEGEFSMDEPLSLEHDYPRPYPRPLSPAPRAAFADLPPDDHPPPRTKPRPPSTLPRLTDDSYENYHKLEPPALDALDALAGLRPRVALTDGLLDAGKLGQLWDSLVALATPAVQVASDTRNDTLTRPLL